MFTRIQSPADERTRQRIHFLRPQHDPVPRPQPPYLGRLSGVGCMRGIELITPDGKPGTRQLAELLTSAREAGLLLMPSGKSRHIIRLLIPLTIEPDVLHEGLDIFERCLAALA